MPDRLTGAAGGSTSTASRERSSRAGIGLLVQALAVVGIFALAGALGAVLWFQLWSPPEGVVADGQWFTDEDGLRSDFSGTGYYVVVAVVAGFLVGALTAYLFDRSELVTLAAVLVGGSVAGLLMLRLGLEWSPADPHVLARTAEEGTRLPGELEVAVPYAWTAFPGSALLGLAVIFLTTTKR